ncbi:cysteine hydrolase family protein [Demequina litorisediminis]|uniref:cysteine hydrolase family protein n=1 Tax=Demequina litorisediminis TaxID=1849022 RepID=UPI003D66544A
MHSGLEPRPEEYLIQKRRYSAFFGSELDIVLKGYRADTLILIGGMTDVCIHYTAVDAHQARLPLPHRLRHGHRLLAARPRCGAARHEVPPA